MKTRLILAFLLIVLAAPPALAEEDAIDKELTQFGDAISTQVQKAAIKKVAVLDFTDLQGNVVELGKFIAEQTTVNLVAGKRNFSVVDRANLNRILAEHKLSVSGLIQPENAKKLGQFSGVDAIVLGTLATFKDSVKITAKVISTETADILGAAKGQLSKAPEILKLLVPSVEQPVTNRPPPPTNTPPPPIAVADNSKQIENMLLKVESFKYSGDDYNGTLLVTLLIRNTSSDKTFGAALHAFDSFSIQTRVFNDRSDEFNFNANSSSGVPYAATERGLVEIKPGGTWDATLVYTARWNGRGGNFGPYRFQFTMLLADADGGRYGSTRKFNFLINIPKAQ